MKKVLLTILSVLLFAGCAIGENKNKPEILTLFSSKSNSENKIWVGTFQLAFNDMKNNIIKHDIEFENEKVTKELQGLNSEEFNSNMLNESTYYTSYGAVSPKAKEKIKKDLKKKFDTTSDIIDSMDWREAVGKYYAYAMLKKEFQFYKAFDKLTPSSFNGSKEKYKFFGITDESSDSLDDNVAVLFYNGKNDYAVRLYTKTDDLVYLFRTNKNDSFDKLYKEMKQQSKDYKGDRFFAANDTLKVPNLKLKEMRNYNELCNKKIKGTNLEFSDAIETIELELDNKGGKVKSEAAIMTKLALISPAGEKPRNFDFDKTFILFLVDKDKNDPYLALRVKNLKGLNK